MRIIKKIEDHAVIYLRYLDNQLLYIGESQSFIKSRHCREDNSIGNFDLIKIFFILCPLYSRFFNNLTQEININ